jgi:hypothetical protein
VARPEQSVASSTRGLPAAARPVPKTARAAPVAGPASERSANAEADDERAAIDELAALLSDADLVELALDLDERVGCHGLPPPLLVVTARDAAGRGTSCVAGAVPDADVACAAYAGLDPERAADAVCAATASPAPDWVKRLRELAVRGGHDWRIAPVPGMARLPALSLRVDVNEYHLLARLGRAWLASAEPVAWSDGIGVGPARLLDLGGSQAPWVAVVTSSYFGGSEGGAHTTHLAVLSFEGDALVERDRRAIAELVWHLAAEERPRYPRGAFSLDARPHLEVALEPVVLAPDAVELVARRVHLPRRLLPRFEEPGCVEDGDLECPVTRLRALARDAGRWRVGPAGIVRLAP